MSKKNILIISSVFIFVIIIGLLGGMFLSGNFDSLFNGFGKEDNIINPNIDNINKNISEKKKMPSAPISVIIDDVEILDENSYELIRDLGINTLIFRTDSNNYKIITDVINSSNNEFYTGIIADVSDDFMYLDEFISTCNTNFIILSGIDETLSKYEDKVKECVSFLRVKDSLIKIGLQPMFISKLEPSINNLISLSYFDFIFLSESNIASESMKTAQEIWINAETDLWLCFNLIGLDEIDGNQAETIINTINSCKNVTNCQAIAFNNFSSLSKPVNKITQNVIDFIKNTESNILDRKFSVINYKENIFNVNEPVVTFNGTSNPLFPLLCNGEEVNTADNGDFSYDCRLSAGNNTISFTHRNEEYTYTVNYIVKILKNVDPVSSVTVPGNMKVDITAVALKNATVKVTFNGRTYDMTKLDDNRDESLNTDFATFTATLNTVNETESIQNLGAYKVTASFDGLKETLTGSTIYVKAKYIPPAVTTTQEASSEQTTEKEETTETTTKPVTTTVSDTTTRKYSRQTTATAKYTRAATTSKTRNSTNKNDENEVSSSSNVLLQRFSYKKNYGLGSAKICEIIDDYVETFPASSTTTFSLPNYSPFLKGTVDYIEDSADFDNITYYLLSSGVKVPVSRKENSAAGQNTKYTHVSVTDGYMMPKNTMHVISCTSYNGETIIKIDMNRKVPFNVKLLGQTYGTYNGRSVKVTSTNFTGLEFTFSDTERVYGTNLTFMNSVIKSGKYYINGGEAVLSLGLETSGRFYGFHYEYDNNDILVITIRNKPENLSDCVIMLDAGHGGYDPGAVCCVTSNSYATEKKINLALALKVKELLESEGATVMMTRSDDRFLGLTDRTEKIRLRNPDMFISLHCDSSSSASAWGTTSYYYRAYSQPLAKSIQQSIVKAYKNKIYSSNSEYASGVDRGTNFYAYKVIRVEECPAVLIEYGFLSNTEECQKLQNASVRNILAQATVDGIVNYYKNY